MTILVLAPHTDDGELGCGGSIAKFAAEGRKIHYAAFSLCSRSLPQGLPADTLANECKKATAILGISGVNITLFDFEVREFPKLRQEILEEMVKLSKKISPDLVFIPSSTDIHQDHGVIHTEALRAFKNSTQLGYELPWNHNQFNSTYFISLSESDIAKKIKALKAYQSQAHRNYMQQDFTRSLAKVRGVQSNTEYAEAFEVYKMIS
ncbi:MAG: PIG-L family deacetylase [Chitinophagaceae bacterium]|nr:PIG-L family deacetylase [Chitinophagaceae bacterium]